MWWYSNSFRHITYIDSILFIARMKRYSMLLMYYLFLEKIRFYFENSRSYKKYENCSQGHHVAKCCLIHCKCAATLVYTSGLPAMQLNVHDKMPITVLVPFSFMINGLPESAVHTPWLNWFLVQIFLQPTLRICLPTASRHSALLITFVVRKCNVFGVGIFWFGCTMP